MEQQEIPEGCLKCERIISCAQSCGKVECPFKLSDIDRAKLRIALKKYEDGRHMIPTLSLK